MFSELDIEQGEDQLGFFPPQVVDEIVEERCGKSRFRRRFAQLFHYCNQRMRVWSNEALLYLAAILLALFYFFGRARGNPNAKHTTKAFPAASGKKSRIPQAIEEEMLAGVMATVSLFGVLSTSGSIKEYADRCTNRAAAIVLFLTTVYSAFGSKIDDLMSVLKLPDRENQSLEFWTNAIVGFDDMYNSAEAGESKYHIGSLVSFATTAPFLYKTVETEGLSALIKKMTNTMQGGKDMIGSILSAMRYFVVHGASYLLGEEFSLKHKNVTRDIDVLLSKLIKMDAEQMGGSSPHSLQEVCELERTTKMTMDAGLKRAAGVKSPLLRASYFQKVKEIKFYWMKIRAQMLSNKQKSPPFVVSITGPPGTGKSTMLPLIQDALHYSDGILENMRVANFSQRDKWDSNMSIMTTGINADDPYQRVPTDDNNFFAWMIDFVNPAPMPLVKADVESKEGQFLLADFFCMSNNREYIDISAAITHEGAYYRRLTTNFRMIPNEKYYKNGKVDSARVKKEFGDTFKNPAPYCTYQEYYFEIKEGSKPKPRNIGKPLTYLELIPRIVENYENHKRRCTYMSSDPITPDDFCATHKCRLTCCPCVKNKRKTLGIRKEDTLFQKMFLKTPPYSFEGESYESVGMMHIRHITHWWTWYRQCVLTSEFPRPFSLNDLHKIKDDIVLQGGSWYDERLFKVPGVSHNFLGVFTGIDPRGRDDFMEVAAAKEKFIFMFKQTGIHLKTIPTSMEFKKNPYDGRRLRTSKETRLSRHYYSILDPDKVTLGNARAEMWHKPLKSRNVKETTQRYSTKGIAEQALNIMHTEYPLSIKDRAKFICVGNAEYATDAAKALALEEFGTTGLDPASGLSRIPESFSWRMHLGRDKPIDEPLSLSLIESALKIAVPFYGPEDRISSVDFWTDVLRYRNSLGYSSTTENEDRFISKLAASMSPGGAQPSADYVFSLYEKHVFSQKPKSTLRALTYLEILRVTANVLRRTMVCSAEEVELDVIPDELNSALFNIRDYEGMANFTDLTDCGAAFIRKFMGDQIPILFVDGAGRNSAISSITGIAAVATGLVTVPLLGIGMGSFAAICSGSFVSLSLFKATCDDSNLQKKTNREEFITLLAHMGVMAPLFLFLRYVFMRNDDTRIRQAVDFVTSNSFSEQKREEVKNGARPKSWETMTKGANVVLGNKAKTSTFEQLKSKVGENTFCMSIRSLNITVSFIASNYAILPGHLMSENPKLEGTLIGLKKNQRFPVIINRSDGVFVPGKDIWIGFVDAGVALHDLRQYLPRSSPTGRTASELVKNKMGILVEIKGLTDFQDTYVSANEKYWGTETELWGQTFQGDCGSMLLCKIGKNAFIGSFHLGFDRAGDKAIGVTLLPGDVDLAIEQLRECDLYPVPVDQSHPDPSKIEFKEYETQDKTPKHLINFQLPSNAKQCSDVMPISRYEKNQMIPHPDKDILKEFGHFDDLVPAEFQKTDKWKYVAEMGAQTPPIDSELIKPAIESYWNKIEPLTCNYQGRLTFEQAWSGVDGVDHLNSVDSSTGAGQPFGTSKSKVVEGIGIDGVRAHVDEAIAKLQAGSCPGWVFDVISKAELRKRGKTARQHAVGPLTCLMVLKMYGGTAMKFFLDHPFETCMAMGLDPQSEHWDTLYKLLTKFGTNRCHGTDYSAFDRTIPKPFKLAAVAIIMRVAKIKCQMEQEDLRILELSLIYCIEPKYLINGVVVCFSIGQASGWFFTALLNCLCSILMRRSSFLSRFALNYDDYVFDSTLGDDVISSISEMIDWNCTHVSIDLKKWNITVTSPDKGEIKPYYSIDEVDFLNRKFTSPRGCPIIVGALKKKSIFKNALGLLPSKVIPVDQQVVDAYRSSVELAWPHGELVYNEVTRIVTKASVQNKRPLGFRLLSYKEIVTSRVGWNSSTPIIYPDPWSDSTWLSWFRTNQGPGEKVENTEFITSDEKNAVDDTAMDPSSSVTPSDQYPIEETFSRPFQIHTVMITGVVDETLNPFQEIMNKTNLFEKLKLKAMIRADLKLRFVVSGNRFMKGAVIASYSPLDGVEDTVSYPKDELTLETQKPHLILRVGENEEGEMILPWVWTEPAIALSSASAFSEMGTLKIQSYSPIGTVGDAAPSATLQLFASLEKVEIAGNSRINQAKFSTVMHKISEVADVAKRIPIPPMAMVADVVSTVSDRIGTMARMAGFSRPRELENPVYTARCGGMMGPGDAPDTSATTALSIGNEHSIDPRIVGTDKDEMIFSEISKKMTHVGAFEWSDNDIPGTVLTRIRVTPTLATEVSANIHAVSASGIVAAPFKYWKGEMELKILVFATSFHGGKLLISYDPLSNDTGIETHITQNYIVDVADLREFTLRVKWAQPDVLKEVDHTFPKIGSSSDLDLEHDNGIISVMVMNQLNAVVGTSESVWGTVMTSFPELIVAGPYPISGFLTHTRRLEEHGESRWMEPFFLCHPANWKEHCVFGKDFYTPHFGEMNTRHMFVIVECKLPTTAGCGDYSLNVPVGRNCLHFEAEFGARQHKLIFEEEVKIHAICFSEQYETFGEMDVDDPEFDSQLIDFDFPSYGVSDNRVDTLSPSFDPTRYNFVLGFGLPSRKVPIGYNELITHRSKTPDTMAILRIAYSGTFLIAGKRREFIPNILFGRIPQAASLTVTVSEADSHADHVARVYSGEMITSIRNMVKRYYKTQTSYSSSAILPLYPLDWITEPSPFSWFSSCFLGVRGNMRYKTFHNGTAEAGIFDVSLGENWDGLQVARGEPLMVEIPIYLRKKFVLSRGPSTPSQSHYYVRITCSGSIGNIYYAAAEDISFSFYLGPPLIHSSAS